MSGRLRCHAPGIIFPSWLEFSNFVGAQCICMRRPIIRIPRHPELRDKVSTNPRPLREYCPWLWKLFTGSTMPYQVSKKVEMSYWSAASGSELCMPSHQFYGQMAILLIKRSELQTQPKARIQVPHDPIAGTFPTQFQDSYQGVWGDTGRNDLPVPSDDRLKA